ncbi:MAG TPA: SEC59/DGK1/VTE5 family protein [Candidatus Dormibacteraeota bacterium]|nr:SEC59/DGK1/VTE5 family protein [Candidatus Dormibacteraeota bacterium]
MTENVRKAVHLLALLVPPVSELTSKPLVVVALSIITVVYVLGEVLRLRGHRLPIITPITLNMSRREERTRFIVRPAYFAIGIILSLVLYPSAIAYASICILAVGDSVAAIVGERFGHRRIVRRKTVEGFAAGLTAAFLLASFLVSPFIALLGAVGAMIMELLDVPDDNLTMPIVAGALMTLATR